MPKRPYPSWQRRHDAILLHIVSCPFDTQKAIAAATGYTASQVSRIMNSPEFRLRYEELLYSAAAQARFERLQSHSRSPTTMR